MTRPRAWLALRVAVHREDRPRLDALLSDWSTLGLIEEESERPDLERITAHFSPATRGKASLESLCRRAFTSPPFAHPVAWRLDLEPDRDWTLAAREYFTGVAVSPRLSVLPPWAPDDHPLAQAPICLRIDPGMAFGTGTHESTRLVLGWLEDLLAPDRRAGPGAPMPRAAARASVLDLGAGSAILAIAAAKLGAGRVTAVEIDPGAEENARRNLALNAVTDRVDYRVGDFRTARLAPADLVLCNMLVEEFEAHLGRLLALTRPRGALVLAGLLALDEAAVLESLRSLGELEVTVRREGEWSSLCVRRRAARRR